MRLFTYFLLLLLSGLTVPVGVVAADHEAIIEGAKKEGSLVFYTSITADHPQKVFAAFNAISSFSPEYRVRRAAMIERTTHATSTNPMAR